MAFTYFFRDMQTLEMIRAHVLPALRCRKFIDIWDAGCATGNEPYSIAIMLRENMGQMMFRNVRIRATDIDGSNLFSKIIEEGIYPRQQIQRIPKPILNRYFQEDILPDNFRICEEIRKSVSFQKHDLLTMDPVGKNFGLIVCKNVLLHFKNDERIRVIRMFYESLVEDGFFATEQTQKMPDELNGLFEPVVSNARIYKKVSRPAQ